MVGCAGMTKQQTQILGSIVGVAALNELGEGHRDRRWAIGLGALAGAMIGNKLLDLLQSLVVFLGLNNSVVRVFDVFSPCRVAFGDREAGRYNSIAGCGHHGEERLELPSGLWRGY